MKAVIYRSKAKGTVKAPPSKSMAHRLLICAGLAEGKSLIKGVEASEDVMATLDCLKALGVECSYDGSTVTVMGKGEIQPKDTLRCRECGSTLRFFIPICLLSEKEALLTGSDRLFKRPLDVYEELCAEKGLGFEKQGSALKVKGKLKGGSYELRGDVSSQFISGLLFALPLAKEDSVISLTGKVESKPYIDMTVAALNDFGVKVLWQDSQSLYIKGSQSYKARETEVEGDYSNAAFLDAFNYLEGEVTVKGLRVDSLQGDKVYIDYFKALEKGGQPLDISDCPDLGPVLFALAAYFGGGDFAGTARLKIKESDRAEAMKAELAKLGVTVTVEENSVSVRGKVQPPKEPLYGHNDHRIVMALSVLLSLCGGEIEGAEAVAKSMPSFFNTIKKLGVECELYE